MLTTKTRPPRVGVALATSTSKEKASCTPVSTTSSSHCTSPSTSCWNPAAGRAAHQGCPIASWSAWRSRRSCWATTPNAAGCGPSMAGWGTCSPTSAGRRPTIAGCAARPRWSPRSCGPWRWPARRGATSGGCWTPPRSHAAKAGRPSSARRWPATPATATTPAITASGGASGCMCWPPRTACRSPGAWPTPTRASARSPRAVGPRRPPRRAAPRHGRAGRQGAGGTPVCSARG